MKLTIREIAPYLPYELKIYVEDNKLHGLYPIETLTACTDTNEVWTNETDDYNISDIQPILRPLSDLTKEIEYNGERFTPIDKLYNTIAECDAEREWIEEAEDNNRISKMIEYVPLTLANYMFQWHIDLFGLIEQGLAIDMNTINEQL